MPNERPNFLLIMTDQWRGDCLRYAGHPVVETPNLDNLANHSVYFRRAYSPSPSCVPARACLATGQSPWHTGKLGYKDREPWTYQDTMMRILRDGGYQTINVGKTHFFPQRNGLGFEINQIYDPQRLSPGFESDYHRWLREESGGKVEDTAMRVDNNTWIVSPWDGPSSLHPTEWTATASLQALKDRDTTRPFFLQMSFHRPHPPYDPPAFYFDMYKDKELPPVPVGDWADDNPPYPFDDFRTDAFYARLPAEILDRTRRAYYGAISHIDAQLARVLYWLVNNGLYDNTTIIFTSDHGELLGDHHAFRKVSPWEGSAGIPMIVKPAASIPYTPGLRDDSTPVSLIDIMPTVLGEAGLGIPDSVDGIALDAAFTGNGLDRPWIHGEHADIEGLGWQFLMDGRHKFMWESGTGRQWLFDLANDPQELRNLVDDKAYASVLETLRKGMVEMLAGRGDGLTDGKTLIPGRVLPPLKSQL